MQTREEKFKAWREEIANNKNIDAPDNQQNIVDEGVDYTSSDVKKNTLTMSIDKIIEAHDEYTTIIEKRVLDEKIKQEQKEKLISTLKTVGKWVLIGIALLTIVAVILIVVLKILN